MAKFLTPTRMKIIEKIIEGKRTREIADELGISIRTVEGNYEDIKELYNAKTMSQAMYLHCKKQMVGLLLNEENNTQLKPTL